MQIPEKRLPFAMISSVLVLILAAAQAGMAESKFSFASTPGLLPKDVIPRHYALRLKPNLESLTFQGSESIEIEASKETHTIVINSLELTLSQVTISGEPSQVATVQIDKAKQTATLVFPGTIEAGRHRLQLEFEGKLASTGNGFYYVKYPPGKAENLLLATEMEPTDARRMFPCWDEPVFRATYQLAVEVPEKFMAVSNMPIEKEEAVGNKHKLVLFQKSPPMSSYLLVLVAGELESLNGEFDGVQIRIVTPKGKKEQGQYALDITRKLLGYYNDYFGIKYPLPKLDQIALPGGFGFGAMENWGGIVYSESVLLSDPTRTPQQMKEVIFSIVSHEMAHLWFGDLVTTAWWDNLWLNEGFASWMGTKASDHFNPEWNVWLRANGSKGWAMWSDAFKTSHPIQQPVSNPSEAIQSFDEITYEKGESILRMLETYLGEDVFRQGIRQYIRAHLYSNATTADLWDALDKASGKTVSNIARSWTEQPGLPLIEVKSSCQNGSRTLMLAQHRFSVNDPVATPLEWQIPIPVATYDPYKALPGVLLQAKSLTIPAGNCDTPIKVNAGNVGYYRVKYDPPTMKQLRKIVGKELPVADRLNLLNDTAALVDAEMASYTDYLEWVEALRQDSNLAVWEEILGTLSSIDDLEEGRPGRDSFQSWGRSLLGPVLASIGWDPKPQEGHNVVELRSRLVLTLGTFGDEQVIEESRKRFQKYLQSPETLNPDIRPSVLSVVGRYSDKTTYEQLRNLGRKTDSEQEKTEFYGAMNGALDPALARESLERTLTDELPTNIAVYSVFGVARDGEHLALAWQFAQEHFKELTAKLPSLGRDSYIPALSELFSDSARAGELEDFCKSNLPQEAWKEVKKSAERIRFKAKLKERELPRVDVWIRDRKPVHLQGAARQ